MKGAFLVNASRSGSTMMSAMLARHPAVLSLSELMTTQGSRALLPGEVSGAAFWRQLSRPSWLMRHLANPHVAPREFLYHHTNGRFDPFACPPVLAVTLPHLFDQPDGVFDDLAPKVSALPRQGRADHYRALARLLADHAGGREIWVERSGGTLMAAGALARSFPEARFVLLLRDGRDVVLSMQSYKPARFVVWIWKQANRFGIDLFAPGTQIGSTSWIAWLEAMSARALPVKRILDTPPSIRDVATCWTAMMQNGLQQIGALAPKRLLVLRYEDIVAEPRSELVRLCDFLGIDQDTRWLQAATGIPRRFPPRYLALPPREQDELCRLTRQGRYLDAAMTPPETAGHNTRARD